MWDFLKKRREAEQRAEQQRKIETVLAMQTEILALYERPAEPLGLADELAAVRARFDQGARGFRVSQDDA